MIKPMRIQRRRSKGWKMPKNTVYVGRPTLFGNPFKTAETFRQMHEVTSPIYGGHTILTVGDDHKVYRCASEQTIIKELAGKNLACWCPLDQPCHADILLEIANS